MINFHTDLAICETHPRYARDTPEIRPRHARDTTWKNQPHLDRLRSIQLRHLHVLLELLVGRAAAARADSSQLTHRDQMLRDRVGVAIVSAQQLLDAVARELDVRALRAGKSERSRNDRL